jgi:hypothetical protein
MTDIVSRIAGDGSTGLVFPWELRALCLGSLLVMTVVCGCQTPPAHTSAPQPYHFLGLFREEQAITVEFVEHGITMTVQPGSDAWRRMRTQLQYCVCSEDLAREDEDFFKKHPETMDVRFRQAGLLVCEAYGDCMVLRVYDSSGTVRYARPEYPLSSERLLGLEAVLVSDGSESSAP